MVIKTNICIQKPPSLRQIPVNTSPIEYFTGMLLPWVDSRGALTGSGFEQKTKIVSDLESFFVLDVESCFVLDVESGQKFQVPNLSCVHDMGRGRRDDLQEIPTLYQRHLPDVTKVGLYLYLYLYLHEIPTLCHCISPQDHQSP